MAASDSNGVGDFVDNDNRHLHLAPNAARFENDDEMHENEIDADEFEDDNSSIIEIIDGMDEIDDDEQDDDDDVDEFNDDHSESTTSECDNFLFTANTFYTPKKVIRVTVDPSVIELKKYTFESCNRLTSVQLSEGLVRIGNSTFECCGMLTQINIPSSVKVIGPYAFFCCGRLEEVELCEGLEELGESAFSDCYALQSITIPSTIKSINRAVFKCCTLLRRVHLPEGLEYIGDLAFACCPSLQNIEIPSTVKYISPDAFSSRALMTVKFCDKVEEFVSGESIKDWWRNGVPKESLKTYNFLVQYKVPARLLLLGVRQWQGNIHDMLRGIPTADFDALDDQFTTIDAKLTVYEIIQAMSLLELAIWKSKLLELAVWKSKICAQHDPSTMGNVSGMERSQCRNNCGACVIIPNVLPFLLKNINQFSSINVRSDER